MKRIKPHSLYALIAALSTHGAVVLVLILLVWYVSESMSASAPPPPREQRVKLSLTENPAVPKEALVKNEIQKPTKTLPIPRGEQLAEPEAITEPSHSEPETAQAAPAPEPSSTTSERVEHSTSEESSDTHEKRMIQELYGDVFTNLSEGEQKFILDNQETMRRITQSVLSRYAPYRIPPGFELEESNTVEFYLHPDGSVSGLRFLQNSQIELLDNVTLETLGIAYKKFPRPAQPTLIRYRIDYILGGN